MTTTANQLSTAAVDRLAQIVRDPEAGPAPVHAGYEIEGLVARGGMGTIYRAVERKLDRRVAMKVLDHPSPEFRARFEREAKSTADLQHPNIVPVFDYGTLEDGRLFYTMKLVEGRALSEVIREMHHSPDPSRHLRPLLRFLCQICDAVEFAHRRGALHCDLKPANIMIGEFNQVWLLDWGLVRREEEWQPAEQRPAEGDDGSAQVAPAASSGKILGTPAYMAPEVARRDASRGSKSTDVYAIGATLFEILGGHAPYKRLSPQAIVDRLRAGVAPDLQGKASPIPTALRSIVGRAMAADPATRYGSAGDIADDLRRWMDGLPVSAHRESWWERTARIAGRQRVVIAVVVCYLVVRIAVLLGLGR